MPPARLMLPDRGPLLTALSSVARMSLLRGAGGERHPRTLTTRDLAGAFRPTGRVGLSQNSCIGQHSCQLTRTKPGRWSAHLIPRTACHGAHYCPIRSRNAARWLFQQQQTGRHSSSKFTAVACKDNSGDPG